MNDNKIVLVCFMIVATVFVMAIFSIPVVSITSFKLLMAVVVLYTALDMVIL